MWQTPEGLSTISADGLEAVFGVRESSNGTMCLRSNHPFPPRQLGLSYFEATVKVQSKAEPDDPDKSESSRPAMSIGLCGEFSNQYEAHPGQPTWSVGYRGDTGIIHQKSAEMWHDTHRTFGPGHTIGCGVDYDRRECIFTLDGQVIYADHRRHDSLLCRKLYPCIGHSAGPGSVKVNFGAAPFVCERASQLCRSY
ncbi:hypothetical protein GGR52DRAFT_394290 [Hypoxylon sp. FL1284]|nr:hypothetical protein GGR52DRAFT_394290 [Hypoxylon sp. FL1284]